MCRKQILSGRNQNLTRAQKREREELVKYKPNKICARRKFKFLKATIIEGVIPTIIKLLLTKRKLAKSEMKK